MNQKLPGAIAPPSDDRIVRLLVFLAACALFLPFLGSFGLWDPWETHYGEVGRQMNERLDWISSWWGTHWSRPGAEPEGNYFYSKPVLLLWLMSGGMKVFGVNPFGARIGVALVAILGVYMAYLAGSRVWSRRAGLLMAMCLGTSPFYAMLGRQSQTDMPFVGMLTVALCFFILANFSKYRDTDAPRHSWWLLVGTLGVFSAFQMYTIGVGLSTWRDDLPGIAAFWLWGPTQVALYSVVGGIVAFTLWKSENRTRSRLHFVWFYVFVALATMAKGLLGFGLPGAIIVLYLLASGDWGLLKRAMVVRGVLIAIVVGFPWYGGMFTLHAAPFWNRFIILDHFKRLASGVHQTDTGSFEHFIRWLGYGLFPWGSFAPIAFATSLREDVDDGQQLQRRARLFIFLWAVFAFALFTASSTKFHHYIFPAVPALAFLAALAIDDRLAGRISDRIWLLVMLAVFAVAVVVGIDLMHEPQNLKNMFTYRYDREWADAAWNPGFVTALKAFVIMALVSLMAFFSRSRAITAVGVLALGVTSFSLSAWALNVYMPTVAHTWSQGGLFDEYYRLCTPSEGPPNAPEQKRYCEEPIIAYRLQWRGETYHSHNEILPLRETEDWDFFVDRNGDNCFYGMGERSSIGSIRSRLPSGQGATMEVLPTDDTLPRLRDIDGELHQEYLDIIGRQNIKFALFRVNCQDTGEDEADNGGEGDGAEDED